jgi:hypothetical protein
MSKVIIAFGSFAAGILFMLVFGSPHTSTVVQTSPELAEEPSPPISSGGSGIERPELIPTVPGLGDTTFQEESFSSTGQQLDGLHCENCSFNNVTFVYGGGAYNLPQARPSDSRVVLIGAAANTFKLLVVLKVCSPQELSPSPSWLSEPDPKIPISMPTDLKGETLNLISLGESK